MMIDGYMIKIIDVVRQMKMKVLKKIIHRLEVAWTQVQ